MNYAGFMDMIIQNNLKKVPMELLEILAILNDFLHCHIHKS